MRENGITCPDAFPPYEKSQRPLVVSETLCILVVDGAVQYITGENNMNSFTVRQIGIIQADERGFRLVLDKPYAAALRGLDGFSHVCALWWFSGCDNDGARGTLEERAAYRTAPAVLGTFATRSPARPNPIALSVAQVLGIDPTAGVVALAYIDADDGTPLLDIKPYTPSLDRVEAPRVPGWCAHWPACLEASGEFDWSREINER